MLCHVRLSIAMHIFNILHTNKALTENYQTKIEYQTDVIRVHTAHDTLRQSSALQ
jgi:hypothetical protein